MAIITRIGYCPCCASSHSPKTGQQFIAFGSKRNDYFVTEAQRNGIIGYVPHIYKAKFLNNGHVSVEKSCAMYECGCDREWKGKYWWYFIKEWKKEVWTLETWNALVLLKHNIFTKDYEI